MAIFNVQVVLDKTVPNKIRYLAEVEQEAASAEQALDKVRERVELAVIPAKGTLLKKAIKSKGQK